MGFRCKGRNNNSQKILGIFLITIMFSTISLSATATIDIIERENVIKDNDESQIVPEDLQKNADDVLPIVGGWDENLGDQSYCYIDGDDLYTIGLYSGITKFNVSQPNNPIVLGTHSVVDDFYYGDFFVRNETMYVQSWNNGFRILNVSDINYVEEYSAINRTFGFNLIDMKEDILLLGNSDEEIFLYDISDSLSPNLLSTINLTANTSDIQDFAVKNNILFVSDFNGDLLTYNLTNPLIPEFIGSYNNTIGLENDNLQFNKDYLYSLQGYREISFYNITDVSNITYITSLNLTGSSSIRECSISDDTLYVMNSTFLIYNITDVSNPLFVSIYPDAVNGVKIILYSNNAYIIDYYQLKILDIINSNNPQLIATFKFGGSTSDISSSGSQIAVANGVDGVLIFDITNKSAPELLVQINASYAYNVILENNFLYVISAHRYIMIYDLTDIENPVLLGSYEAPHVYNHYANFIKDGNYLILMLFSGGIEVIDISDPSSPNAVYEYLSESFTSRDIALYKNRLYLLGVGPPGDILIFDFDDYNNIILIKILAITNIEGKSIFIENNVLYMLGYNDLSDKDYIYYYKIKFNDNYQLDGYYDAGDYATTDIIVSGNYIYLSSYYYGIVVFRKSSFNLFELYIPFTNNQTGLKMTLHDGFIYLASGLYGFVIYQAFEAINDLSMLFTILGVVGGLAIFVVAAILFMRYRYRKELNKSMEEEEKEEVEEESKETEDIKG